jgi:hypothetical protein
MAGDALRASRFAAFDDDSLERSGGCGLEDQGLDLYGFCPYRREEILDARKEVPEAGPEEALPEGDGYCCGPGRDGDQGVAHGRCERTKEGAPHARLQRRTKKPRTGDRAR